MMPQEEDYWWEHRMRRLCGIEGCERIHSARGMCNTHYWAAYQAGAFTVVAEPTPKPKPRRLRRIVTTETGGRYTEWVTG